MADRDSKYFDEKLDTYSHLDGISTYIDKDLSILTEVKNGTNKEPFKGIFYGIDERTRVHLYMRIMALFSEYSGIGTFDLKEITEELRILVRTGIYINARNTKITGNHFGYGGEVFHFTAYKDITYIEDYSDILYSTDPNDKPITITLPTTDFLKLIEYIIKTTPQEKE